MARKTIGVAHGNGGDAALPGGAERPAVADRIAGANVARGHDLGANLHGGAQIDTGTVARSDAEKSDAGPHQIEPSRARSKQRGAVGSVAHFGLDPLRTGDGGGPV